MSTSREFGKTPNNHYKPGFIDTSTSEMMKMSIDRELGEISKAMYKTDEVANTKDNGIYKGTWNPKVGAYPDANQENSWWDVITDNDAVVNFDGKNWKTFQKLQYNTETRTYKLVEDTSSQIVKERIDELRVSSGSNEAAIEALERVVIDGDTALALRIDTVEAGYKSEDTTIKASVTTETQARVSGDSANASRIETVKTELEGSIASVNTTATTALTKTGQLEAKWGVRVNVNNKVTGIQLNNNGNQTSFAVQADQFIISDGTSNTGAPFEVVGGVTKIKNASVGTISSDNWDGANNGWAITKDGYANFQNVIVRGNLSANTFTGIGGGGNTFSCSQRPKNTSGSVVILESFSITQATQQSSFILVNRPMIVLFGYGRVFLRLRRKDTNAIVASGYGMTYLTNINDGVPVTISLTGSVPAGFSGTMELEGYMDNSHGLGGGAWQADGGSNGDWTLYRTV